MRILCIGNSFSQDSTRYLHQIARANGEKLSVCNLYIAGCKLDKHYRNMLSEEKAYDIQYNGHHTGFKVSLKEALLNRDWDVVTLQQFSGSSARLDTYYPYITELAAYVRKLVPQAKLLVHQTWAYEDGSERLFKLAKFQTAAEMTEKLVAAYAHVAKDIQADGLIPSGKLFHKLLACGIPSVQRDTFHASLGLGRYALGLLWYHVLTGKSVMDIDYCDLDEPITPEEMQICKTCAESFAPIF